VIGDGYAIGEERGFRHFIWDFCADDRASDDAEMCVHVSKEVRRGVCKCGG
jgi:hypothetical protein